MVQYYWCSQYKPFLVCWSVLAGKYMYQSVKIKKWFMAWWVMAKRDDSKGSSHS